MSTIRDALKNARARIDAVDARMLLCHAIAISKEYLAAHPEQTLSPSQITRFSALVEDRCRGVPVAYLIGTREFYGLDFEVTPDVLIPRPETELLVDLALERVPLDGPASILDLGTGSGAIAIAIAFHRPLANLVAIDVSRDALNVASANARRLLPSRQSQLVFMKGDWYEPVKGQSFDVILSNPPYISENDSHLNEGDLRFEPSAALTPGGDGLAAIRQVITGATGYLRPGGWLLFEHGYDQGEHCRNLLAAAGFKNIHTFVDLATLPRISGGTLD